MHSSVTNPDTAVPHPKVAVPTHGIATAAWCVMLLAVSGVDAALLSRALRARSQRAELERLRARDQMPIRIGSCEGIDTNGGLVSSICHDKSVVVIVLTRDNLRSQVSVGTALLDAAGQRPTRPFGIMGVCGDDECARMLREVADPPFPVLSSASYGLARAAGVANQQGAVLVVGLDGTVRGRVPVARSAVEAPGLLQRIVEILDAPASSSWPP
jgi:hypothetical protein